MTRDEIINMPAGREIDGLIAVHVLGITNVDKIRCPYCSSEMWVGKKRSRCTNCNEWRYSPYKTYSDDIGDAWEVFEKIRGDCDGGFEPEYMTLICYKELQPNWYCAKIWAHHDGDIPILEVTAESAPLAICRAALLSVMEPD